MAHFMKSPHVDPRLQQRLEEAELRLPEVDSQLASPEVLSSPKRLKDLGRERARLDEIVTASRELRSAIEGHSEAVELLQETDDPEMKGLAEEEISVLGKRIEQLAANVRAAKPDIVAFQEVRHDAVRDSQAETLARALPFSTHPSHSLLLLTPPLP